jgi:hypothetical protein
MIMGPSLSFPICKLGARPTISQEFLGKQTRVQVETGLYKVGVGFPFPLFYTLPSSQFLFIFLCSNFNQLSKFNSKIASQFQEAPLEAFPSPNIPKDMVYTSHVL